jgi:osmotically-inducible protein OsmY
MRLFAIFSLLLALLLPAVAAEPVSDDVLYDQVRIRLANDRTVGGENIEVKVTDGVVELSGKVRLEKNRERAEKVVRKVKGVRSVINRIQVAPV